MASPLAIPALRGQTAHGAHNGSSEGWSPYSWSCPPERFLSGEVSPKLASSPSTMGSMTLSNPPSPSTCKKLLRVRTMAEHARKSSLTSTIPTEVNDINVAWAKLLINQHRIKHLKTPINADSKVIMFEVKDCKKSYGDLSSTCRVVIVVDIDGDEVRYVFIAKLLPPDDPRRVYVFESNVFEKEISIYFELLPYIRQFLLPFPQFEKLLSENLPICIYGSNSGNGAGVLAFECAREKDFLHPVDPDGLSLSQLNSTVKFIAKFHAIGSALIIKKGKDLRLRYPFLESNIYANPMMIEEADNLFDVYSRFISSVPGQSSLLERFEGLKSSKGAKLMYSCMRRQVSTPFNTIIHGEFWEKNILYKDCGDVGDDLECLVLDWKNAKIASATKDLAFLMLSSTNNHLRTECLNTILQEYFSIFCQTLEQLGVDVSGKMTFEDFYSDYKISLEGAFLQTVCVLVLEMQYLEQKLQESSSKEDSDMEMLRLFEKRALNLLNDGVILEIL